MESAPGIACESCVLCSNSEADLILEKNLSEFPQPFRLFRCRRCQLVRTEPRLSGETIESHYGEGYWGKIDSDDLAWIRRDQRFRTNFLHRFRTGGKILDVGCGPGYFLRALDPASWDRYGIEPMPVPQAEAARRLGENRVLRAELDASVLLGEQFDVVTFWDSLEHMPNPAEVLRNAARLLRPGGLVVLTLPNFGGYQARHFGEDWFELSLPHHLTHFTPATIRRLLESCGFRISVLENRDGSENYHSLKHSLLNRLTRLHGPSARTRYALARPLLHPWEWVSTRLGGGASLQIGATLSAERSQ